MSKTVEQERARHIDHMCYLAKHHREMATEFEVLARQHRERATRCRLEAERHQRLLNQTQEEE